MEHRLMCENCAWIGVESGCNKQYRAILLTDGDVELHLLCPKCGSEDLIELSDRGARVLAPA